MISLEKLKPTKAVGIILAISQLSVVFLSIFLLNRPLFLSLDLWQLLGISIGITAPSLFCFAIFYTLVFKSVEIPTDKEEREAMRWTFAGYLGTPLWAMGLFYCYLIKLPLKHFCTGMVISHILLVLASILIGYKREQKKKNTSEPAS
jgi:hypothetical protein